MHILMRNTRTLDQMFFTMEPFVLEQGDILSIVHCDGDDVRKRNEFFKFTKTLIPQCEISKPHDVVDDDLAIWNIGFGEPKIRWEGFDPKCRKWTLHRFLNKRYGLSIYKCRLHLRNYSI